MEKQVALDWMNLFHEKIQANKDYLSELDTPIGDGDHGGNMARGLSAVVDALSETQPETPAAIFKLVAMQLLSKVGGASGPLYGSAFMGLSKSQEAGEDLLAGLLAALEMIQKRGKADVGEKTMVDVWTGVIEHLKAGTLTKANIEALVLATKPMQATKGRASYVGERSVGHIDPGAYSSGLLFEALLEAGGV